MNKLTERQEMLLQAIHDNDHGQTWVSIEPEDIGSDQFHEVLDEARTLESRKLIEVSYPADTIFAIRFGERIPMDETSRLACAITVEGIKALRG